MTSGLTKHSAYRQILNQLSYMDMCIMYQSSPAGQAESLKLMLSKGIDASPLISRVAHTCMYMYMHVHYPDWD